MVIQIKMGYKSPKKIALLADKYEKEIRAALHTELGLLSRHLLGRLREEAPGGATGNLRQGHDAVVTGTRLTLFSRIQYALWAHEGRKPGKFPWDRTIPKEKNPPLQSWVKTKGIADSVMRQENALRRASHARSKRKLKGTFRRMTIDEAARVASFLVARKIAKKGTKPNRWFKRVLQTERSLISSRLGNATRKAIDKAARASDGL